MIKLDITNVREESIGSRYGLSNARFNHYLKRYAHIIKEIQKERKADQHNFLELPYNQHKTVARIESFARQTSHRYKNVVVLGIGGSALGTFALQNALKPAFYNLLTPKARNNYPRLFILDNVDPDETQALFNLINPKETIFNVVSKSGATTETIADLLITLDYLKKSIGRNYQKHIAVTTGQQGPLKEWATKADLTTFEVPQPVQGRYAVLSPVGLLPAALIGIPINRILAGAARIDKLCQSSTPARNPAFVAALVNFLMDTRSQRPILVTMPYAYALKSMADWFRQIWAESLGKRYNLLGQEVWRGPTPVSSLGVTDQHSQLQLYTEGPQDKLVVFLEITNFNSTVKIPSFLANDLNSGFLGNSSLNKLIHDEKKGTELSLVKSHRPNYTITLERSSPESIGGLIYLFELMTAYAGKLYDVNPYDQPGVEDGKKFTFALMGKKGYERVKSELKKLRNFCH
jgi:glucose-6-phosphate isomerase